MSVRFSVDPVYLKLIMAIVSAAVIYVWAELKYRKKIKDADKRFEQIMGALAERYDKEKKDESKTNKNN